MLLWKHHIARTFENKDIKVVGVGTGGNMHEDLDYLIKHCQGRKNEFYVAPVECTERDVVPDPEMGKGWYAALHDIPLKEEFMPLEEAARRYLKKH